MCLVPLSEGCGVDLDDSGFGQGVGADEFVVGGVEGHADDAHFARDAFGGPAETAGVDAEGPILGVPATGADEMDSLGADAGVGWLAAFLESSGMRESVSGELLRGGMS